MRLPLGSIVLIVVGVLIYFGVAHRVLDRMRLTDRAALAYILAMIVGGFFNVNLARSPELTVNFGGAVVPLVIAGYLLVTADEAQEKLRGIAAILVTGGAVYALSKVVNPEEQTMLVDPVYIFAIVAGLVAYLAGRSRRAAFAAGVTGMILADIALWVELLTRGMPGRVWLGGAGVFDGTVIAGLLAVVLAEVVGEAREKLKGGSKTEERERQREAASGAWPDRRDTGEGGDKRA